MLIPANQSCYFFINPENKTFIILLIMIFCFNISVGQNCLKCQKYIEKFEYFLPVLQLCLKLIMIVNGKKWFFLDSKIEMDHLINCIQKTLTFNTEMYEYCQELII